MEEENQKTIQSENQNQEQNYPYNPDQAFKKNPYKKIGYAATLAIIGIVIVTVFVFLVVPNNNQIEPYVPNNTDSTVGLLSNTNNTNQTNSTLENNTLENITISVVSNDSNNLSLENN